MNKKNRYKKYDLGSWVKPMSQSGTAQVQAGGQLAGMVGGAIGGETGNVLSGVGSGVAAGAALGPIGAIAGGALGLVGGLLGNAKAKREAKAKEKREYDAKMVKYNEKLDSELDTSNDNAYGTLSYAEGGTVKGDPIKSQLKINDVMYMADGGEVIPSIINIEKNELQIDPNKKGKILREYTGINPETGGLYEPHAKKGQDTRNNFVTAEEGTFIITKKLAKDYKESIANNDKIRQSTILQNIKNTKERKTGKFAGGGDVPFYLNPQSANPANGSDWLNFGYDPGYTPGTLQNNPAATSKIVSTQPSSGLTVKPTMKTSVDTPHFVDVKEPFSVQNALDSAINYAPALLNIGRGLFGKTDHINNVNPITNPYKSKILDNMPDYVSLDPVKQEYMRQQKKAFMNIDNNTNSPAVARANKNAIFANTQTALGKVAMDQQIQNNAIRQQRAGVYGNLGAQEMQELARTQGINLGIDQQNRNNVEAKRNLLNTGIGQLQQTYLNNKANKSKANMDAMLLEALKQMSPSIIPYLDKMIAKKNGNK